MSQTPTATLDGAARPQPIAFIREAIRAERPYRVDTEVDSAAKLDQNESPFDLPEPVARAARKAFEAMQWNRYPGDRPHRLIERLAEFTSWSPEGIIVGRGSNELAHSLALSLIEEGVRVVLPRPMFALYESVVRMHRGEIVSVAPKSDFSHSAGDVIEVMRSSQAQVTIICSPNNPTGQAFSPDELEAIAEAAPGILIIDEAYSEMEEGPTALEVVRRHPHVIVVRTFSKAMGLAAARIGYLVADPELVAELEKARLPFLVDGVSEAVALAMLDQQEVVRERARALVSAREELLRLLRERDDVEVLPSAANFFLLRSALQPAELYRALLEGGARVRNVSAYPFLDGSMGPSDRFDTGWVRVSVGTEAENSAFLAALDRLPR